MAGKPIQVIHRIIHGDTKSSGTQNAATQSSEGKLDKNFEDQFLDSIKNATNRLKIDSNCSANLFEFMKLSPPNAPTGVGELFHSGMSLIGVDNPFSTDSIGANICLFTSKSVNTLDFFIELALKQALILFRRIDVYKRNLELVLLNFNNNIKSCLIKTLIDTKTLINRTANIVVDFSALADIMVACPCVEDILRNMFRLDCFEDNKGNPNAIVECLEDIGFGASEMLCYVNAFIDRAMKNVSQLFNKFEDVIKTTMDSLLAPFRDLVKQYCLLLTTKFDVSFIMKPAQQTGFDCLFIYTLETNRITNVKTPSMNVLDIVKTYKTWVNCFDTICSSFSDELRRKIRAINDDLRLNFKHWNDPNVMDIFISCLFLSDGNNSTRSTTVREVFSRFRNSNARTVFGDVSDTFKDLGKFPISTFVSLCSPETDADGNVTSVTSIEVPESIASSESLNPITDSIVNSDGLEEENINIVNPTLLFKKEVEELIILMIRNIGNAVTLDAYPEIFSELIEWEIIYRKTQKHLNAINAVNIAITNAAASSISTAARQVDEVENVLPSYVILDDFSELNGVEKPERRQNEDLVSYYARWYDLETS